MSPLIKSLSRANLAQEIAAPIRFQATNTQPLNADIEQSDCHKERA